MRKLVLFLAILFSVPSFAQEAFYIYRHDGDFNGFFYDEVVVQQKNDIHKKKRILGALFRCLMLFDVV